MSAAMTHPFSHLGAPPYRYLGHSYESYQAVRGDPNCPIQPGGSCDHCGTGIYDIFRFKSADGRTFKVGSSCVEKADRQLTQAIKKDVNNNRKERANARTDAKIATAVARLDEARPLLEAQPHPTAYMANGGHTLAGFVDWILEHGGRSGKLRAAQEITRTLNTQEKA